MTIAVIAAEDFELHGLRQRLPEILEVSLPPVRHAYRAAWQGHTLLLCAHGPGFALAGEAARQAIAKAAPDRIWSVGLCGGLRAGLRAGQVVTAEKVIDAATGESFEALPFAGMPAVTLVSQDRVASDAAEKAALAAHGDAVDMESAAVARQARARGIPFQCIKVVSDAAHEGFAIDLNRARDRDGRFAATRVVLEALRRPLRGLPELAHLYRRSRAGAERLGDWLGNCRV